MLQFGGAIRHRLSGEDEYDIESKWPQVREGRPYEIAILMEGSRHRQP